MGDDWQDLVIETGVDTLLDYLAENDQASASKISEDLGVSESRIKGWSKSLESNGFIERTYSARKGLVLRYTRNNKQEIDEKLEEVKEEVDKEAKKAQKEIKSRGSKIQEKKKELVKLTEKIEKNREDEEEIKNRLKELEELEEEIEEKLSKEEERREKVHSETVELLSRIDNTLERIEEAEEQAERFDSKSEELRKKLKALKKLEKHSDSVEELDKDLKDLNETRNEAGTIFASFKKKISDIFGSDTEKYSYILSKPVEDVKEHIDEKEDLDYEKLLKAEENGKNRKTVKSYIKRVKND